ncbi:MAG: hypothetical protein ACJAZ3_000606 [Sphingobacteriales bacterium]|jgi:hypothetical protein
MKISGFTMVKNATKLYYPIGESIASILPIVDEFIVALGDCDEDDHTRDEILKLNSDKIKIIDTVWNLTEYPRGMENAHQTDIAKSHCSGDWLIYLQADEVIHENDFNTIKKACELYKDDPKIEGLLFKYNHFWGDYNHVHRSYGWYPHEIRIVKNDNDIHSYESAQSFRRIPNFDGKSYRTKEGSKKLNVALIDAYIYHYGWVRPPKYMQNKKYALDTVHHGTAGATNINKNFANEFDYGPLDKVPRYSGTHPKVMVNKIKQFDWGNKVRLDGDYPTNRKLFKHEMPKSKLITWLNKTFMPNYTLGGFKNYNLVKKIPNT